jgi:ADP-heptose:LPS heptosyltransferase
MLVERFPRYFDDWKHFPGYPGLPEQPVNPVSFLSFLSEMQTERFDLAIQMQGNGSIVNPMVELFNARLIAGFCRLNDYCPDPTLFIEYPTRISEIERHLLLMNHLGITGMDTRLEFPILKKDVEELDKLGLEVEPKKYVCVHPGSRGAWRQWPPAYFANLADYCITMGFQVVITGTQGEMPVVEEVIKHMKYKPVNAAGKTSLGALGLLIKNAFAIICNCTGVSHMASALEIPSVVISMDGEPERWAPLNKIVHRTIDWTKTSNYELVFRETVSTLEKGIVSGAISGIT